MSFSFSPDDPAIIAELRHLQASLDLFLRGDFQAATHSFSSIQKEGSAIFEKIRSACPEHLFGDYYSPEFLEEEDNPVDLAREEFEALNLPYGDALLTLGCSLVGERKSFDGSFYLVYQSIENAILGCSDFMSFSKFYSTEHMEFLGSAPAGTIIRESYGELYEKLESGNWRCLTTLEGVPGSYSEYQTWENIPVEYLHDSYLKWQADKVTILFIPEQD